MALLSIDTNAKTKKGQSFGYITGIMYLAPFKEAGRGNVCPHASEGCASACLYTAGRGAMKNVKDARVKRTHFYFDDYQSFFNQLVQEIGALVRKSTKKNMIPCVRLNGTSDIPWEHKKFKHNGERKTIMDVFPQLTFYDYTKNVKRMFAKLPKNYSLTFSRSEENDDKVLDVIKNTKENVAVVFKNELPKFYMGRKVVNADESDLRFLDEKNVVCGLKAKGEAKTDDSGFVLDYAEDALYGVEHKEEK